MKRALALLICLAAVWCVYGIGVELLIAWYSGAEIESGPLAWVHLAVQLVVDGAAAVLAWRIVREPRRAKA